MTDNYYEKVYAGFLGMNIGIRLGVPLEPGYWTEESIQRTYGEVKNYVKDYINFAADDDANGPVYFLRALDDKKDKSGKLVPEDVANAWLNYTREGTGMFWWGGYGISTEHTAYENLKQGIKAPVSGSIECNGKVVAEQIGGQIFIDTWGLIHPGNPKRAAEDGAAAASVSHDGEGVNGARFICACIAEAFHAKTVEDIIQAGLREIPEHSLYSQVVKSVADFYYHNPDDFRACFHMLERDWGYDKFEGACHIIPNAGVCALALYYGKGDFSRTVEVACMCDWDTDCNAGNVGTITGVFQGLQGIPKHYREVINDFVILSGISGYLNILDIPSYAKEIAFHGYRMSKESMPEFLQPKPGELFFDFRLPGSTHGMRISNLYYCRVNPLGESSFKGENVLGILIDDLGEASCNIFYKSFYGREDFSDERYSPVFSPKIYPGQEVSISLCIHLDKGDKFDLIPYVKTFANHKIIELKVIDYAVEDWFELNFTIPDTDGDLIEEVGFIIRGGAFPQETVNGFLYIRKFHVHGMASYSIDMRKQRYEFGAITPFAVNGGNWSGEGKALCCHRAEKAFAYTGNYYSKNYSVTADVRPAFGESHLVLARSKGAMMGYAAGFSKADKVAILKNDFGYQCVREIDYPWSIGEVYRMEFKAVDQTISLYIDGNLVLEVRDDSFEYGMFGFGALSYGRTYFGNIKFQEMES